jgi:superfamily II DNA or RNA helicase
MITREEALANKIRLQEEGEATWIRNSCRGTICWATGVGKTRLGIKCIKYIRSICVDPKILIVVPTQDLRDSNWPAEFEECKVSMRFITIVCYASLSKTDLTQYQFIIYDEVHKLTPENMTKLSLVRQYKYLLGLTATFPKVTAHNLNRVGLLEDLLPPIHTVSTDEAVELGLIADFEIKVLKLKLNDSVKNIPCGTKKKEFRTEQEHYAKLTKRIQYATIKKAEGLKFGLLSKRTQFIYNLPTKFRIAQECLNSIHKDDKRTIVFTGSIEKAEKLCGELVFHSKSSDEAFDKFQRGEVNLLGCCKALNEGTNLYKPDQAIIDQVSSVDRDLIQRIGRIIRFRYDNPTFKGLIIILVVKDTVDEKWYESSIEGFNTKRITEYTIK